MGTREDHRALTGEDVTTNNGGDAVIVAVDPNGARVVLARLMTAPITTQGAGR